MIQANHANAYNYLRERLRPRELSITRALLEGELAQAKGLIAFDEANYTPPKDDISSGITALLDYLKTCMKPENYSKAELMAGNICALSRRRIEEHHTALNEANSKGTTNAGPPATPAQDSRPAGLRADSMDVFARRSTGPGLDALLYGDARRDAAEDKRSHERFMANLDRIRIL